MRPVSLIGRGIANYFLKRPFCVSFEITYNCNARCKHCHLGGPVKEQRATPEKFGELYRKLKPVVAQVSGGEPLLRKDLEQIIAAIKEPNGVPFMVLTTNAALLSKERYYCLRQAGVDEFSISLDYPDERHDEFRHIPGLFKRIEALIKEIGPEKDKAITLACVIQRDNLKELIKMAKLAKEWEVNISFSAYTWLRTKSKDFMIPENELEELKNILNQLLEFKKQYKTVFTSDYVLRKMIDYFKNEGIPHCRAGKKFLIVNPDGTLSPCGLIIKEYNTREEMERDFVKKNTCESCYTASRANSEKPAWYLLKDNIKSIL